MKTYAITLTLTEDEVQAFIDRGRPLNELDIRVWLAISNGEHQEVTE